MHITFSQHKIRFLFIITVFILIFVNAYSQEAGVQHVDSQQVKVRIFYLIKLKKLIFKEPENQFQITIRSKNQLQVISKKVNAVQIIFLPDGSAQISNQLAPLFTGKWDSIQVKPSSEKHILVGNRIIPPRPYSGSFLIEHQTSKSPITSSAYCFNLVSRSQYLASVVGAEISGITHSLDSLKAQAVASRSYASFKRHKDYHLCDTTHCQVYLGLKSVSYITERAVSETKNEVLTFENKVIKAYYHSTCGGHTSSAKDIWGSFGKEYLVGVKDVGINGNPYCIDSPHFRWRNQIKVSQLTSIFLNRKSASKSLTFSEWIYDSAGRIIKLKLTSPTHSRILTGEKFRILIGRNLGWNRIKSSLFTAQSREGFTYFGGRGLGHGVGLCQYGAAKMGLLGISYRAILKHYFPKCKLSRQSD